jgi:hypothetical protein
MYSIFYNIYFPSCVCSKIMKFITLHFVCRHISPCEVILHSESPSVLVNMFVDFHALQKRWLVVLYYSISETN